MRQGVDETGIRPVFVWIISAAAPSRRKRVPSRNPNDIRRREIVSQPDSFPRIARPVAGIRQVTEHRRARERQAIIRLDGAWIDVDQPPNTSARIRSTAESGAVNTGVFTAARTASAARDVEKCASMIASQSANSGARAATNRL